MERLAELAVGSLSASDRDRLADHVVACQRCAEQYSILARTHAETLPGRQGSRPLLAWLVAAAIAIVAVAGVWIVSSSKREDALRGALDSPGTVVPGDGARLGEPPTALRWPAQAGAEGYRARLFTPAGDSLWEANARGPELAVPESVRSRLRSGQTYFWTVEVQMPLEKQRLGPYSFTLHP